ncbi:MAG: DUF1553 domain-containing protein [Verrucomicrobiota bacterium]
MSAWSSNFCARIGILLLILAASAAFANGNSPFNNSSVSFYDDIKPLLSVHCYKCHGSDKQKGNLQLDTRAHAIAGGKSGKPAIDPGNSQRSEILRRIQSTDPDEQMPPEGQRLTSSQIALIQRWIDAGAIWPDRDDYWAFQPPREIEPPRTRQTASIRNPIDRFIQFRLEQAGITPAPQADARTRLRRAYADLIGLPPTPAEAEAFLKDKSPDAFERLVDRLLNDPRYGERWARHWLDLARYGESDGYEDDKIRPRAWRYRDYVVRALNQDKPYDRFVQEQIAGDEMWPNDSDAWIATGFARLGAWDGMSKEPEKQWQDFLNDATDVMGSVFLGVTLGCARCHDHKYDVISQRDYYRMQGFLAGVKRDTRDWPHGLQEPAAVKFAFQSDHSRLQQRRNERDELLQRARQALERERTGPSASAEQKKFSDADIAKKAETEAPGQLARLNEQITELDRRVRLSEPKLDAVFRDGTPPRETRLLLGGELHRPGPEVQPGFVDALAPANASAEHVDANRRRSALAHWLTSADHPLTARVIVNRLWQHHFGEGIVATPSDFGRNGKRPTHPELLDWLARELIRQGWSLKKMHRLMMTSAAYQRASTHVAAAAAKDPENQLLWRMNRRRLESEAIRDTMLAVSGRLHLAIGGPGVYAQLPHGVNVAFPNNDKELSWGLSTPEQNVRRSIYLFQRRTLTFPLMEVFDAAPMNQSCATRPQTTVAPQALALFNGEFAREAARWFGERLEREAGHDPGDKIQHAFHLAFSRPPTRKEMKQAKQFLAEQAARRHSEPDPQRMAWTDFCHVLLNANELIYID